MKRVSFKIAKAIKAAGYPQYPLIPAYQDDVIKEFIEKREDICDDVPTYACPTYLEVWLWLWRKKKIAVEADYSLQHGYWINGGICGESFEDPEDAIIEAIEYLVDNDLIS